MPRNCVLFSHHGGHADFFAHGLCVAIESVRLTNPSVPIVVLHNGLTAAEQASLRGCRVIHVGEPLFEATHRPDLTAATFFKFHVAQLEAFDRVLYLDSDLVVLDSLDDVFEMPGVLAARRQEFSLADEFSDPALVARREGLSDDGPFPNGGVICFDREFWASEQILAQARRIADEYGPSAFLNADQGILTILAHRYGGFAELPIAYNYCRWPDMVSAGDIAVAKNRLGLFAPLVQNPGHGVPPADDHLAHPTRGRLASIVHWNGPVKPWEFQARDGEQFVSICYEQVRARLLPA
ncbi:MAG: hypothetical protein H0X67_01220 [Acidobacteria bacterium]|nr:hypothetical protein [Acidobacteriota bacterium]